MKARLLGIAGMLVFVSAAIHLSLGVSGLFEAITSGGSALLPALYLLGGLAALALLGVIALTPVTTTAYAAGAGLMVLFLLAYADVHAFGVAESTLGVEFHDHGEHTHDHNGEGHSHDHDDGHNGHDHNGHDHGDDSHDHDGETMTVLANHLLDDAYALVSKAAETSAVVVFTVLSLLRK
jgi:hypothetical protein